MFLFAYKNRRIAVFGARTIFCLRALYFLQEIERRFSTPNRPMPMPRSIAVLENHRKRSKKIIAFATSLFRRRTHADASIDRGARKRSKKSYHLQYVRLMKSTHRGFRDPNVFLLAHPIFSSRNRTLFFRRRTDPCRCLDRSRCSKTVENRTIAIVFPHCLQSPGHSPLWSSSLATAHPLAFHRLRIAPTKTDFIAGA